MCALFEFYLNCEAQYSGAHNAPTAVGFNYNKAYFSELIFNWNTIRNDGFRFFNPDSCVALKSFLYTVRLHNMIQSSTFYSNSMFSSLNCVPSEISESLPIHKELHVRNIP